MVVVLYDDSVEKYDDKSGCDFYCFVVDGVIFVVVIILYINCFVFEVDIKIG